MPVFKSGETAPDWCELTHFEIVRLARGEADAFRRRDAKAKLIVADGECRVTIGDQTREGNAGANLDLPDNIDQLEIDNVATTVTLIWMDGCWGGETGGSGLFAANEGGEGVDRGDPAYYPKATTFDRHFHDCDEYWILIEGSGMAVSEGKFYEVGPGDCVATGMGHHHDLPKIFAPVRAVYVETTLMGAKRHGHLWEHTHGPALPAPERT